MRILFSMRHLGFIRNFESALCALAQSGHRIHIAYEEDVRPGQAEAAERLTNQYPAVTFGPGPKYTTPTQAGKFYVWFALAKAVRLGLDYLRYLHPRFQDAPKLRSRIQERAPSLIVGMSRLPVMRSQGGLRLLTAFLRFVERAIPWNHEVEQFIASQQPDLVLMTPLLWFGAPQVDYVRSARALGLRTVLCVGSWDHLTSKGLIYDQPDLVTVWNEMQKTEAVELHGIPPDQVVVTGAQTYDHWFDWQSRARGIFCQLIGLVPDRPFFLYTCSSNFIAPNETEFVRTWIRHLRSSAHPQLREAGILIRPHPQHAEQWKTVDVSGFDNVVVWPQGGANPVDREAKADYFDSLYHSVAVVGLNTSAQIEAGIVGRPVYTILSSEFAGTQEGTLHFHHLTNVNGGLLYVADSFDSHVAQLAAVLSEEGGNEHRSRRFVEAFIRPYGLDVAATPRLVDAIEALGAMAAARPVRAPFWTPLVWMPLYPVAAIGMVALKVRLWRGKAKVVLKRLKKWLSPRFRGASIRRRMVTVVVNLFLRRRRVRWFLRRHIVPRFVPRQPQAVTGANHNTPELRNTPLALHETRALVKEARAQAGRKPRVQNSTNLESVQNTLLELKQSDKPIVIGPWLGEVGFEVLYWIPFLHWATEFAGLRDRRLIIVSRGGPAPWYRRLATTYQDVFDHFTPEEFQAGNVQRMVDQQAHTYKQELVSNFELEIIERIKQSVGEPEIELLHPSLMYNLFNAFWRKQVSIKLIDTCTTFHRFPALEGGALDGQLPEDYIAVKFYGNRSFPDTQANRLCVAQLMRELTQRTEVVLLDTGLRVDDHEDFTLADKSRLHTVTHLMTPQNNLAIQTEVVGRARAFVGTYGGFSYLAPCYGVDSVALYSHPEQFSFRHLELAQQVFMNPPGAFVALNVAELDLLRATLGTPPGSDNSACKTKGATDLILQEDDLEAQGA